MTAVALLLYLFRSPLLTLLAQTLISDDQPAKSPTVLVLGGDRSLETVADDFHAGNVRHILLPDPPSSRVEEMGVLPTAYERACALLGTLKVPPDAVNRLPGIYRDDWELADAVAQWLDSHPDEFLSVYVDRFSSCRLHKILRSVLGADQERVRLVAQTHRDYDETNWWHSKLGTLHFTYAALSLGHVTLAGRPSSPPNPRTVNAYEGALP